MIRWCLKNIEIEEYNNDVSGSNNNYYLMNKDIICLENIEIEIVGCSSSSVSNIRGISYG